MSERFAGRFALLRSLGRGGMGEVWLARDLETGAECAIKRLEVRADAELAERLQAEFEALSRIRHPVVVEVRELGFTPDGRPFLVMEFVPGLPADRALARGDWPALFWTAAQVVQGLEALHAAGITHGDVKPLNLLVTPAADASRAALPSDMRLVDFGLAALRGRADRGGAGTLGFTAPEVARGGVANAASDLYSLGATLFALATGRPAHGTGRASSVLRRQNEGPPPADELERAGVPDPLVRLILQLMAPNPAERPASARDVRLALAAMHPAARRPLLERLATESFVGRARESARIAQALAAASRSTQALLFEGPAGIGKTSLLSSALARAELGRHLVLRVTPMLDRSPGAVAMALFRRIAAAAEASTLVEGDDARVDAAALQLAKVALSGHPAVMAIDDASELDERSLALLVRLLIHPRKPPALWLWARRGDDGTALDVAADAGLIRRMAIGPLSVDSMERLVSTRLGSIAPTGLASALHERVQGHPGLVLEMLRLAAAEGALLEVEGGISFDRAVFDRLPLPTEFERASLARLISLSPRALECAAYLAACDGRASASEFETQGLPLAAEQAAELLRLPMITRDGNGVWSLDPPSLCGPLLDAVGPEAARTARELALRRSGISDLERFRLFDELGMPQEALDAAERAWAVHANESLAVRAADLATRSSHVRATEWWLRGAESARRAGRYAVAAERYEQALESTEPLHEPPPQASDSPGARGRAWEGLATCLFRSGAWARLTEMLERGFAEPLHAVTRGHLLVAAVARETHRNSLEAMATLSNELDEVARQCGDPEVLALAGINRSVLAARRGDSEEEARILREVLHSSSGRVTRLLERRLDLMVLERQLMQFDRESDLHALEALTADVRTEGLRLALSHGLWILTRLYSRRGMWQSVMEIQSESLRVGIEDGRHLDVGVALSNLAIFDSLMGHSEAALRRARAVYRFASEEQQPHWGARRAVVRALRNRGSLRRAERIARRAVDLARSLSDAPEAAWSRLELAWTLIQRGRWKGAAEVVEPPADAPGVSDVESALFEVLAGRCALRVRGPAEGLPVAASRLARVEAWLARANAPYARAHAAILRAELAVMRDDVSATGDAVREALENFERLPCPGDRAASLLDLVELASARALVDRLPIAEWLQQARQVFERFHDDASCLRTYRLELRGPVQVHAPGGDDWQDRELIEAITGLLRSLSDLPELARRALELAGRRFGADRGVLVLRDPETEELSPHATYGEVDEDVHDRAMEYSTAIVHEVTRTGASRIIRNMIDGPRSASRTRLGLESLLCVPLFIRGEVSGALYMHSRSPDAFTDADRGLLEAFSSLLALAIESSRGQTEAEREYAQLVDENLRLRKAVDDRIGSDELIRGAHPKLQRMLAEIHHAARTPRTSVLITGETGVGKELVALRIHALSDRKNRKFLAFNCSQVPRELLADGLFGHVRGAYSSADRDAHGVFVQANGGTLFLDEIAEIPLDQQVTLLRVLQSREVQRLGDPRPIPVDVRVIAATNQDLGQLVRDGKFRPDLYHRLHVIPIHVPPLRERKSDIPMLLEHFVAKAANEMGRPVPRISKQLLATVVRSDWPGNVRELENYVERLVAMNEGGVLVPTPLPNDLAAAEAAKAAGEAGAGRMAETLEQIEVRLIRDALEQARGNQSQAAKILDMPESNLRYRLRKYSGQLPRKKLRTRN